MKYRIAIIVAAALAITACSENKPEPASIERPLPHFIVNCKEQYKRNNNQTIDTPLMFQYCGCLSNTWAAETSNGRTEQNKVFQNEMLVRCREATAITQPKGN